MSNSNMLEIVQGLAQAAANAYDGAHDERLVRDGEVKKVGLRREHGCAIMDKRVIDGFKVKFYGDSLCINYQSDIKLKEVYAGGFESDIESMINEIKSFLQKEYKVITGKGVTLTPKGEPEILVQSVSRVRSFVNAYQHFKISRLKMDPILAPSEKKEDNLVKEFLQRTRKGNVL